MSDCLFNLYAEYISEMLSRMSYKMESRLPGEIINNHRYADDITLMAESKEELKSLLMTVKEESEKAGLKLNIKLLGEISITSDMQMTPLLWQKVNRN